MTVQLATTAYKMSLIYSLKHAQCHCFRTIQCTHMNLETTAGINICTIASAYMQIYTTTYGHGYLHHATIHNY